MWQTSGGHVLGQTLQPAQTARLTIDIDTDAGTRSYQGRRRLKRRRVGV